MAASWSRVEMTGKPFCAVVDWGTSSFRLWLLGDDRTIRAERQTAQGLSRLSKGDFADVLEANLADVEAPPSLPVVICGMAGSRQGWHEAPYLSLPCSLESPVRDAVEITGLDRRIWILPGLAQRDRDHPDVIRGEETQLIGAFSDRKDSLVACLPGTHSKWVMVEDRHVTRFSTYMTGELYEAVTRHTILAASRSAPFDESSFLDGVDQALSHPFDLTTSLFSVRGADLLGFSHSGSTASAVSGLLIGYEIASAQHADRTGRGVELVASGVLAERYATAFRHAGIAFDLVDADNAVLAGLHSAAKRLVPAIHVKEHS